MFIPTLFTRISKRALSPDSPSQSWISEKKESNPSVVDTSATTPVTSKPHFSFHSFVTFVRSSWFRLQINIRHPFFASSSTTAYISMDGLGNERNFCNIASVNIPYPIELTFPIPFVPPVTTAVVFGGKFQPASLDPWTADRRAQQESTRQKRSCVMPRRVPIKDFIERDCSSKAVVKLFLQSCQDLRNAPASNSEVCSVGIGWCLDFLTSVEKHHPGRTSLSRKICARSVF